MSNTNQAAAQKLMTQASTFQGANQMKPQGQFNNVNINDYLKNMGYFNNYASQCYPPLNNVGTGHQQNFYGMPLRNFQMAYQRQGL